VRWSDDGRISRIFPAPMHTSSTTHIDRARRSGSPLGIERRSNRGVGR
jgi:hypothetical protein